MKVLLPTEYYPPFVMGGGEISTKLLAEGLAREGVEVHVLTPNYESFSNTVSEGKSVHLHRFRSIRRFLHRGRKAFQVSYRRRRPLFYWLLSKYIRFSAREFSKRISKLHERENFDLIHAQNLESILGLNLAGVKCPRIAHIRDFGLFCMNRGKLIGGRLCSSCSINDIRACLGTGRFFAGSIWNELNWRRAHSGFDHYIAISNFVAGELGKEGIPDEKISIVYNPIGDEEISHLSRKEAKKSLGLDYEKVALFVGDLTEAKGAHLLPKLARKMPNVNFVVVGDGPLSGLFEERPNNLHYRGHVPHEEVKHYFRAADILLVPSLWHEPFGRVVVEGQINSTPVVASKTGGILELVGDGKTGLLTEPGKLKDLVEKLSLLLENAKLRDKMGEKGRKIAKERFKTKIIMRRMVEVYRKIL